MQVSVNRRIVAPKIVQDFDVDKNVRDHERREPEMSRTTRFDEQPRTEVKWGEGNWASSMTCDRIAQRVDCPTPMPATSECVERLFNPTKSKAA
jgi:hypothetical protein